MRTVRSASWATGSLPSSQGASAHTAVTFGAPAALAERHPGIPVVLLGHSMGGRAALAPAASYAYAARAKAAGVAICRFDLPGAGHFMLTRLGDWNRLVRRFVLGVTGIEPLDPVIANALAQPAPQGLTAQLEEMESAR